MAQIQRFCGVCGKELTQQERKEGWEVHEACLEQAAATARNVSGSDEGELEHEEEEGELVTIPERYAALGTISGIFRVLGWIVLPGGILLSLFGAAVGAAEADGAVFAVYVFLVRFLGGTMGSVISGVILLAYADLIALLIDVEQNTRATALNVAEIDQA